MSGREIILPVGLLLFCDGGERSEDVLKKRSFPSPGLFVRLRSGVIILCLYSAGLIGLVVVVPDFVRSQFFHWPVGRLQAILCDVHRRVCPRALPLLLVFDDFLRTG